ncbi:FecR family protein [Dyadobacter arcticus]|uniref:Ferric-dicitrate binding protein FerR (Iron transport regulator) n=1 Tax=Dyadobacter arcticus TaxID=1078754 RepID=A0ABX0UH86_9BACT|nr:FecR domain-containing protein [Dyadobacter arcticus]NIJ52384.1 ferric-dicitrate binding protein FerR (iron transport regulator) [Dyadobacter arcticus]
MKQELNYHIDDLLVKSLLDEATIAEQIEISQWLSESEDNLRYFEHFEMIWTRSKQLATQHHLDENAAWERFKKRTQTGQEDVTVLPLYPKRTFGVLRIAAMITLTACASWLIFLFVFRNADNEQLVVHSGAKTLIDTLPDGSVVTLNKKSTISYPAHFTGKTREVALTGEGFFEVTPDKSKPFIISVNKVIVRVVGTSFNVKESDSETEVIVETGIVEVARDHKMVRLRPMQKVTVNESAGLVKEETREEFHKFYRTGKLVCDGTPLWRLVEILNENFESEIVIGNVSLRDLTINTTFDQTSLESILAVISETLAVKVEHHGKHIILK